MRSLFSAVLALIVFCLLEFALLPAASAQLTPGNVLVIYNDPGQAESSAGYHIYTHYRTRRPGVLGFNLNDATLQAGRVTHADFAAKIRDPIRAHLVEQDLTQSIRVLLLTKGIPHQIDDINAPGLGNSGGGVYPYFLDGNITYASVDSELTLLWHDLGAQEAGGNTDSKADNFVLNPYFLKTDFGPASPNIATGEGVQFQKADALDHDEETTYRHWKLSPADPGLLYLTARLDGNSVSDVLDMIDRAQQVTIDSKRYVALFDASTRTLDSQGLIDDDPDTRSHAAYDRAAHTLAGMGWHQVILDRTADFYLGMTDEAFRGMTPLAERKQIQDPVIFLASFGGNHTSSPDEAGWAATYAGQLPHGALFNTFESYNGRKFGGIAPHPEQAQVADWIADGGTFGLAHVWEPFTFGVGWDDTLITNFYGEGLTWVEAAWSSIQVLSWQNIVVGDPLATVTLFDDLPQLTLSLTSIPGGLEVLEEDAGVYTVTITSDRPLAADLDINLSFQGATPGVDFYNTIFGSPSGIATRVTLPAGQQAVSFDVIIVDDEIDEELEILTVSLAESSLDLNGDGYGEGYGFTKAASTARIPIADTPFAWWNYTHFGGLVSGDADHDADGLNHLWEYFLGSDPNAATGPGTVDALTPLQAFIEGETLIFEVPKVFPRDVRLSLQSTSSLKSGEWSELLGRSGNGTWELSSGTSIGITSPPGLHDRVTVTTSQTPRRFVRFALSEISFP